MTGAGRGERRGSVVGGTSNKGVGAKISSYIQTGGSGSFGPVEVSGLTIDERHPLAAQHNASTGLGYIRSNTRFSEGQVRMGTVTLIVW